MKLKKKDEDIQVYKVDPEKMKQMVANIKLGCDLRKNFIPKNTKLGPIDTEKNHYEYTYGGPIDKNKELDSDDYKWFKENHNPYQVMGLILDSK
jgi:hypothetical protein